LITNFKIS